MSIKDFPPDQLETEFGSRLMVQAFTEAVAKELRKRILEKIEPDIEAAIESALATLKIGIESYFSPQDMRHTVRLLVERKDVPEKKA